jgi:hypothetical protein
MPQLATARTREAIAIAVQSHHRRYPFLAIVNVPDLAGGPDTLALYGCSTSTNDAMVEGLNAHPGASYGQEIETISTERLNEMRKGHTDPKAQALKNLGLVKPDGTPLF